MKQPKIIFFLAGAIPTEEEKETAAAFGIKVAWRNVQYIDVESRAEDCDGVAGAIPANYEHLPTAEEALFDYNVEQQRLKNLVGDVEAPKLETVESEKVKQAAKQTGNPAVKAAAGWSKNKT